MPWPKYTPAALEEVAYWLLALCTARRKRGAGRAARPLEDAPLELSARSAAAAASWTESRLSAPVGTSKLRCHGGTALMGSWPARGPAGVAVVATCGRSLSPEDGKTPTTAPPHKPSRAVTASDVSSFIVWRAVRLPLPLPDKLPSASGAAVAIPSISSSSAG
ncbi:hypothetical protein Vafri_3155 [Volvox africanus]|uniref:Uncharacterized protein n=1 Tax=Volvox africanus TaxID=51714 RepID=A0A8J4ARQ2_9CHLO|nr:hypothetical protein Vafri_3155 [Volvox africanus]